MGKLIVKNGFAAVLAVAAFRRACHVQDISANWAEHSQGIAGLYFGAIMLFFAPTLFQMEDTHEQKVSAYPVG